MEVFILSLKASLTFFSTLSAASSSATRALRDWTSSLQTDFPLSISSSPCQDEWEGVYLLDILSISTVGSKRSDGEGWGYLASIGSSGSSLGYCDSNNSFSFFGLSA